MPKKPQTSHTVAHIRRLDTPNERYAFSLSSHGFVFNGFIYDRSTKSIQMPSCKFDGRRVQLVKAFGVHITRLRAQLETIIEDNAAYDHARTQVS